MTLFIQELLNQIKQEKKDIGDIIDDRSLNRIPLHQYALYYKKLESIENAINEIATKTE